MNTSASLQNPQGVPAPQTLPDYRELVTRVRNLELILARTLRRVEHLESARRAAG